MEQLLREMDRRVEQAQRSAGIAIEKAELAVDKRLTLLNEFRTMAEDRSARFALKDTTDRLLERIEALEASRDRVYGGLLIVALIGVANLVKLFWIE